MRTAWQALCIAAVCASLAMAGNTNSCPSGAVVVTPNVMPLGATYTVQASGLRRNTVYTLFTRLVNCFGAWCETLTTTASYTSDSKGNLTYSATANPTYGGLYSIEFDRYDANGHVTMDACANFTVQSSTAPINKTPAPPKNLRAQ